MAAEACFDVVELLEHILLELPSEDLIAIRRVSKTWKTLLERSLPLRGAMFLEPHGELVRRHLPYYRDEMYAEQATALDATDINILPFFRITRASGFYYAYPDRMDIYQLPTKRWEIGTCRIDFDRGWSTNTLPPNVAAMFISQPPVTYVGLEIGCSPWKSHASMHSEDGLTVGPVIDALNRMFTSLTAEQVEMMLEKSEWKQYFG